MTDAARNGAPAVDWSAIERMPEFQGARDRAATIRMGGGRVRIGLGVLYVVLVATAPDLMGTSLAGSFSLGFAGGVLLILLTWAITLTYMRRSTRLWAPLEAHVRERAHAGPGPPGRPAGVPAPRPSSGAMTPLAIGTGVNELALASSRSSWRSRSSSPTGRRSGRAPRPSSGPPAAASPALQNGFAMAGDYLSASTFLGFAGLIFLFGVDGWVGLAAAGASFLPVVLLLAERMRNAGKFTMADVLAFRLQRAARRGWPRRSGRCRVVRLPDRADGRRGRAAPGARRASTSRCRSC